MALYIRLCRSIHGLHRAILRDKELYITKYSLSKVLCVDRRLFVREFVGDLCSRYPVAGIVVVQVPQMMLLGLTQGVDLWATSHPGWPQKGLCKAIGPFKTLHKPT